MIEMHDLAALWRAVAAARREVNDARRRQSAPGILGPAVKQQELLLALEDYAAELSRRGQPRPYRLHNELMMYRLMFHPHRPDRGPSSPRD